jgi:hypothetical protein
MTALECGPGPHVGQLVNMQIEWQFLNPAGTTEECLEFMKDQLRTLQQFGISSRSSNNR